MSGHSKWSTIKRKKEAQDSKRGKIFARLSKEISVAVREGKNADPDTNPRLRLALQNARASNMPKENIEKALQKGQGGDQKNLHIQVYEGYGPSGTAIYVECMTDNVHRTVSQIRHIFSKYGGNLTTSGSLSFLFSRKGYFLVEKDNIDTDETLALKLIDAGAEEFETIDAQSAIYCPFEAFGNLQKTIESENVPIIEANTVRIPHTFAETDPQHLSTLQKLLHTLDENEDVQEIFHNCPPDLLTE